LGSLGWREEGIMKSRIKLISRYCRVLLLLALSYPSGAGALVGARAPEFELKDLSGGVHRLASLKQRPMVMLYFFDAASKPSHSGLSALDRLCAKYGGGQLTVWAITRSDRQQIERFVAQSPIGVPILMDSGPVSQSYQADRILPTTCILGPDLQVMDLLQGGGQSAEVMLSRLAQRALQRRKSAFAAAVVKEVVHDDPQNVDARITGAYAALSMGKLDESGSAFARLAEQGQVAGLEGLSAVAAKKGQVQRALELAAKVEQADPSRGYVHVVKADVLYSQNKKQAAEKEYRKAIDKKNTAPFHQAKAYNQLGRMQAEQGHFDQALSLYDQAEAQDPYYIEASTNKGLLYERQGRYDQALASYARARRIDETDRFSLVLQKKLVALLETQRDQSERSRIDGLVKELAERYRSGKPAKSQAASDGWTSRPMVLSFVDMSQSGGLAERDGFAQVLTDQLADSLNGTGRVQVVERALVEKLLQELNLGSSELADPAAALELGKVLSAKLIVTGTLYYQQGDYLLTLRLIDTETTRIAKVMTAELDGPESVVKDINRLRGRILDTVVEQYPLQGYVVQADADQVVNLGAGQGVVAGTRFEILEPSEPMTYRGRQLQGLAKVIGQVEIVQVEADFCRGRVLHAARPLARDDKLREKSMVSDGRKL
jgi:tetratricopeptide (TPR) repeat protein/peroxiredoxin